MSLFLLATLHQSHGKENFRKKNRRRAQGKQSRPENENTESTTAEPPEPKAKAKAKWAAKARPGMNKPAAAKAGGKQGSKGEKKLATKKYQETSEQKSWKIRRVRRQKEKQAGSHSGLGLWFHLV